MSGLILVLSLAFCFSSGILGSAFTMPAIPGWYASVRKPSWTPPSWLFGPVWSVLYAMMGTAAWLVWRRVGFSGSPVAFWAFGVQLALNAAWSIVFFGMRRPMAAFVEIVCLWGAIVWTIVAFRQVDIVASMLLVPYLVWVTFAAVLTYAIARLNEPLRARRLPGSDAKRV